ncbi:hypothetical protein CJD38_11560 [Stenotrophobium rhamnosiphilum]|uniref:Uncharacterized protein n=2 Tax=Stenotrophobium rhamnosiphilum TaxID=2029166 RepID=A0A2T5MED0_9GAMM|nr:hypothetical protein CJD38_11560 [Stenotrophobium rhamnosiphilum]
MFMAASGVQAQQTSSSAVLINEALTVDAAAVRTNTSTDITRAQAYIGSTAEAPFIRDITLRLNDSAPVRYEFSDSESRALQRNAQYQVTLSGIKEGVNQLRADFHTATASDKGIKVFKQGQLTKSFSSGSSGVTLVLTLSKATLINDASFDVSIRESTAGTLGNQLSAVDFMMTDGEYFSAASVLMRLMANNQDATLVEAINKRLSVCRAALGLQAIESTQIGSDPLTIRFNQALLLIQQGKGFEATTELDAIGLSEVTESSALTLRDQANLVLAYYFLNQSQGDKAIPVFERIRSPGPYSNGGLLGLGWALLLPVNREGVASPITTARYPTIVTPRLTADIVALQREQAPRVPSASKFQQTALRKALVPWTELIGRDPTDPTVQEGMLAIAWTLYHFGAYAQAQVDYNRAADQFDKVRGWYDNAIASIRSGGMIAAINARDAVNDSGWAQVNASLPPARARWWQGDTPETPKNVTDTFYFERLLLSNDFAEALQAYRNLMLADGAIKNSNDELHSRLSAAIAGQRTQLESIAVTNLTAQKKQLDKYLIEARFALATIYDRPELASAQ